MIRRRSASRLGVRRGVRECASVRLGHLSVFCHGETDQTASFVSRLMESNSLPAQMDVRVVRADERFAKKDSSTRSENCGEGRRAAYVEASTESRATGERWGPKDDERDGSLEPLQVSRG